MNRFVGNVLMVILAIVMLTGCYIAGRLSVDPEVEQVVMRVDDDLLTAARIYYKVADAELFYLGNQLCFRKDGRLCVVGTGAFLWWYHESYLKDSDSMDDGRWTMDDEEGER